MKEHMKDTDRTLQLILLIVIGIAALSVFGWFFLVFLFPILGLIQLLSAAFRTAESIIKKDKNLRFFFGYWIMVAVWANINGFIWHQTSFSESIFSQMGASILIAIYYYSRIRKIDNMEKSEWERKEIEENRRLAAMMK
jgi:phosphoglycerol transferase MdoB-like AlkP superfamily enzyme